MNFEIAGSHVTYVQQAKAQVKPKEAPAAAPVRPDSASVGPKVAPQLDMEEHNKFQLDLMKRMGVDPHSNESMIGWIKEHAGPFGDFIESDGANGIRQQLRQPDGRAGALAAVHELLLKER